MNFLNTCIATKALLRRLFLIVVILIETHTRDYLKIEALPLELVNEKNILFALVTPFLYHMPQITLFEWPSFTRINESLLPQLDIMPIYPKLCCGWELERVCGN